MYSGTCSWLIESSLIGNVYSLVTTIAYASGHFFAQLVILASPDFPKMELGFVRSTVEAIMIVPFLLSFRVSLIIGKDQALVVITICISAFINVAANYFAFGHVPLSTVLTISATCPIFTILFSRCILKEKCKWIDVVASVLSIIGVIFIARPVFIFGKYGAKDELFQKSSDSSELVYYACCGLALITAIAKAICIVMGRKWTQICPETRMLLIPDFYTNFAIAVLSAFTVMFTGKSLILPEPLYARCALFSVGILTAIGGFTQYLAVKVQTAGVVGIIRNTDILYAYFLEYLVLNLIPNWWCVGGAITIITSSVIIFFRERLTFSWEREEVDDKY